MSVRRNDRRRRLMNDEFVRTIEPESPANNDEQSIISEVRSARRTYASGADRRNQLRTTDLFPKRTWIIVTLGLLLVCVVVAINGLAFNAPSWRSVIGVEGVAALQLSGKGTLASWFVGFLMVSVSLVTLQIYAMRRHRCDDYVGTYRMWMWFPPVFLVASLGSIVDVVTIARGLFASTLAISLPTGSLIPFVVMLCVLAAVAGRVLYEVKESRAAVAMLVLAWMALAISITMQSEWAGSKIAADERQFVLGNSYLIAAVSLLIGHLFYTRFVYLHAHGLIVRKQSRATKAVAKSVAPIAPAHSGRRAGSEPVTVAQSGEVAKSGKSARNELSAVSKRSSVKATAAKKTEAKRASSKSPATASSANKQPVKTTAEAAESSPATMNSFQSLLEKRKRDQRAAAVANEPSADEADAPATIKMSKAERRRARKAKRADRKAA